MQERNDLLAMALAWLAERGVLGIALAAASTKLRLLMRYDRSLRDVAVSFFAALFAIAVLAPGVAEIFGLEHRGAAMAGAILGLVARPMLEALINLIRLVGNDTVTLIRVLRGIPPKEGDE